MVLIWEHNGNNGKMEKWNTPNMGHYSPSETKCVAPKGAFTINWFRAVMPIIVGFTFNKLNLLARG